MREMMGNYVLKAELGVLHISPLGFHRYASEFLRAAQGFKISDGFSPVPYYLICRSIELALKSFLLAKGVPKRTLKERKLSHNLEKVLKKAVSLGLDKVISIPPQHKEELRKANTYYDSKGFEYFEVTSAAIGYPNLPDLRVLSDLASFLITRLKPLCLQATDGPL
jgi:HEPN domain-containing protein